MRIVWTRTPSILIGAVLLAFSGAAEAKGFRELYRFAGGNDGEASVNKLALDAAGNVYGVTPANDSAPGTVFMVAPDGTKTILHTFQIVAGQASSPMSGLAMDPQGNLYGEAFDGGAFQCPDNLLLNPNCGSIYKLAPDGTLTTIYHFQGGEDGGIPLGGLLLDNAGNLYGTTKMGGAGDFCTGGCGTVFKLAPNGTKTVLYNFAGQSDGAAPVSSLIADTNGNLYGTTPLGGHDHGTVFRIAPDGTETQLYAFNGTDGDQPAGSLAMDAAGNLYGTTATGGSAGAGEVFRLAANGTLDVLHAFGFQDGDGTYPKGGVVIDRKGNLFGTTLQGGKGCGAYGCGTVYRIAADGSYTQLYKFKGRVAYNPYGGLVADHDGNLIGGALGPFEDPAHLGLLFAVHK